MCAIAGILDLNYTSGAVERMLSSMSRRGPDGWGTEKLDRGIIMHTRLSVIDPEGGAQPMSTELQGERYTIVYNGELYNAHELRRELQKLGHEFHTKCDTEVLLHAYARWKGECLKKLNGIFAFAVWHHKDKKLFLARDRIGVKPLFYSLYQGGLLFASEIKTILAYPGFRAVLDCQGAAEILLLGPGRTPGCGVFRDVLEIEPGCSALWEKGKLTVNRYWKLIDRDHRESFDETADHVRYLVTDAIRRQMVSDVPVGTFLSGGLDSSLISAVCAAELKKEGRRLPTFSVDYENNRKYFVPGKFQPNSDSDFIGIMEQHLNSDAHRVELSIQALSDTLEEATRARDLPGMADVDFSLLLFCREIRKDVTVALSGECADEIFGGYPWYRDPEIRRRDGFPWAQSTQTRRALLSPGLEEKLKPLDYISDRYEQTLAQSDILPGNSGLERRMKQMVNLNFRWFMQTLLDRKDRMSMHSALEVRVPFCDYRIAEYLYAIPWEMKDYKGSEKGLLRYAMRGWLPEKILWRKKSPKTYDPIYLSLMQEKLVRILNDPHSPLWQLVNRNRLREFLDSDSPWPWYGQLMGKPQTMAYFVQFDYWLHHYDVDISI